MSGESPDEGRSAWAEKRPKRSEGKNGEPLADNLAEIDSCRPDRSLADVLDYLLADADSQQLVAQRRNLKLAITALLREYRQRCEHKRWTAAWRLWVEHQAQLPEQARWVGQP